MILGIDTAGAVASVALVEGGKVLVERIHPHLGSRAAPAGFSLSRGSHAEVLLPLIQELLEETRASLDDISGLALSIGPGSFTGLRIGLATVKGLAYECGLPVVGISTLHAHAARVERFDGIVCALLDARKQEVYTALFRSASCRLERITKDELTSIEKALARVRSQRDGSNDALAFVGDGAAAYEKVIGQEFRGAGLFFDPGSVAAAVARLAEGPLRAGLSEDIGTLAPFYLRSSGAESKLRKSSLTC